MNRIYTKNCIEFLEEHNCIEETIFNNANGYIGVRGSLSEGVPQNWDTMRGMYINGFYDVIPMKQAENLCNFINEKDSILNVADTMTIFCEVDGCRVDMHEGKVLEHMRTLDMENGVTKRRLLWESPEGKQIEINETRLTSFELLNLFSIEYSVKAVNFDGEVKIRSFHCTEVRNYSNPKDPRTAAESNKNLTLKDFRVNGNSTIAICETTVSHLRMCSAVCNVVSGVDGIIEATSLDDNTAQYTAVAELEKGESIKLIKLSIFTDSLREEDIASAAEEKLGEACSKGIDYYYESQRRFMDDFWKNSMLEIDGDDELNIAVSFNLYELLQSAANDDKCSIASKGISGEGYEGHYFWDTETFVLPFFLHTNPKIAKKLLEYRYSTIEQAKDNAKLIGHSKGALYPWRTITGKECSGYFVSGSAAYHINADIAYAVVKYYLATDDDLFLEEKGAEILLETARLWLDVGNYDREGHFVIHEVTGPDEYTCMIDNNYYTNCAAKYNLKWAAKIFRDLESKGKAEPIRTKLGVTENELMEMDKAAEKMLLLYDEKLGINPQDDTFLSKPVWNLEETPKENFPLLLHYHPLKLYRYQICKQADTVLAYFMFENEQSKEVMERSFRYYEKITSHDSSLSKCIFSIVASRLGLEKEAIDYFGDSAKLDLENRHNNTQHGIHTANMGGSYMAIINGFAGVRIDEDGLSAAPVIPDKWKSLKFNITYRGRLLGFKVTSDELCVELIEGDSIDIKLYGERCELIPDSIFTCRIKRKC